MTHSQSLDPNIKNLEKISEESLKSLLIEEQVNQLDSESLNHVIKELALNDLFFLAKYLLGYKDLTKRTHGEICEVLQDQKVKRKLIVCPRGSFKSSLGVVAFSIFRAIQNPNIRILVDSELYTNSSNFIREIRLHLESTALTSLFGEFRTRHDWASGNLTIAQRTKNLKESTFSSGGIGTTRVGQHYDLIIMDDMNSNSNSQTPEACDKVYRHYLYNNAILDPGGEVVVIGTRYSGSDLIQRILENEVGVSDNETYQSPRTLIY